MWSIGEVKREGWRKLKDYYWPAFVVTIITLILGGEGCSSNVGGSAGRNSDTIQHGAFSEGINGISSFANNIMAFTIMAVVIGIIIICLALKIFVGNPVTVGQNRFFMESRALGRSAGIERVFWVFKSGHYMNVVKIMFLRDLYNMLWYFALIIPGVIKAYEYMMIPYILSENPEADSRDVFALTKDMTDNQKFNIFIFELSFIGWIILGVFTCGIGMLFVAPYMVAATSEIYAALRGGIGGFPFGGFGVPEEENTYQQYYGDGQ